MATLGIHNEILKIAQTYGIKLSGVNPYTNLSPQDIGNKWETVSQRGDKPKANSTKTNDFQWLYYRWTFVELSLHRQPLFHWDEVCGLVWGEVDILFINGTFLQQFIKQSI